MTARRAPLLVALAGLVLALVQGSGHRLDYNHELLFLKHLAMPELYRGDPLMLETMARGFYLFGPELAGRLLLALGLRGHFFAAVDALQLGLWGLQIYFFHRLAQAVVGRAASAALAALCFAWGVPLLRFIDAPFYPSPGLGRSLGLTALLPALALYFKGRRDAAWLLTTAAAYLHGNPAVYVLMLITLSEAWETWVASQRPAVLARRVALALLALVPIAATELGGPPIPPDYAAFSFRGVGLYEPLPHRVPTDWLLFLEGAAWIAAAWTSLRGLSTHSLFKRLIVCSALLIPASALFRLVAYPLGLPLAATLVKVTACFSFLVLVEILGLVAICHALARGFEDKRRLGPLAFVLFALLAARQGDFALKAWGLGVFFLLQRDRVRAAWGLAVAGCAVFGAAALGGEALRGAVTRLTGTGGGFLSLPAFRPAVAAALAALLGAASLWQRRPKAWPAAPALLALLAAAAVLRSPAPPAGEPAWAATMRWIKENTPRDSFILLPYGKGLTFFQFSFEAERSAWCPYTRQAAMLYEHGPAALWAMDRMKDYGYDFSCCNNPDPEGWRPEAERVNRAVDFEKWRFFSAKHGLTHGVFVEPYNPARALVPVFESGPYKVYRAPS